MSQRHPVPHARFPINLPIRCPIDGGQLELTSPNDVCCTECGAGVRRITREIERLKAVVNPESSDVEKAAKRLQKTVPEVAAKHWYDLPAASRNRLLQGVREVVKTLREGLA